MLYVRPFYILWENAEIYNIVLEEQWFETELAAEHITVKKNSPLPVCLNKRVYQIFNEARSKGIALCSPCDIMENAT